MAVHDFLRRAVALIVLVAKGGASDGKFEVFVMAGIEGTGHHLFDEIGMHLSRALPLVKEAEAARYSVQLCWTTLAEARHPCDKPTLERRSKCLATQEKSGSVCTLNEAPAVAQIAFVPGCSYPCGSPRQATGLVGSSPDLIQLANEVALGGYGFKVISMIREPFATVYSSWSRRHKPEASFRATAFNLYMHLGYLDAQLTQIDEAQRIFIYYEHLIRKENGTLETISNFLQGGITFPILSHAISMATTHRPHKRRSLREGYQKHNSYLSTHTHHNAQSATLQLKSDQSTSHYHDRLYLRHLFYRPAARSWIPTFWPYLQKYQCPSSSTTRAASHPLSSCLFPPQPSS